MSLDTGIFWSCFLAQAREWTERWEIPRQALLRTRNCVGGVDVAPRLTRPPETCAEIIHYICLGKLTILLINFDKKYCESWLYL